MEPSKTGHYYIRATRGARNGSPPHRLKRTVAQPLPSALEGMPSPSVDDSQFPGAATLNANDRMPRLLLLPDVIYYTGLGRSTIFAKMKKNGPIYDPDFPKRIKVDHAKGIAFDSREIARWIELQIAKSKETEQ